MNKIYNLKKEVFTFTLIGISAVLIDISTYIVLVSLTKLITLSKFISFISKGSNELQSIVETKYPIIKKLLRSIKNEKGCHFSRMTGSGSVCYGLFTKQIQAKKALNNLKIKYPKFWLSLAKTV